MTIEFQCSCGSQQSVKDELAGGKSRCRSCGADFIIPALSTAAAMPTVNPMRRPSAMGPSAAESDAASPISGGTATETCENCGAKIGRLQTPVLVDGHVVCAGCEQALHAERQPKKDADDTDSSGDLKATALRVSRASGAKAKEAVRSTGAALAILAKNPTQGLSQAFDQLGPKQALLVGIVCAICFDVAALLFAYRLLGDLMGGSPVFGGPDSSEPVSAYFKALVVATLPLLSIAAAIFTGRLLGRGKGRWEGDVFVAGLAILPFAVAMLAFFVLGMGNLELVLMITLIAQCYLVLTIFHGFKDLAGLSPALSAIAVPATLILSVYIVKVVITAMFT